jgi:tyrosyl-tRNA synthetase
MIKLFKNMELIIDRLQEVIGLEELKEIVKERSLKIYWGTAPTGRIHIGYLVPLLKIADLHAVLDNLKSTPELINKRTEYYELMIKTILKHLHCPLEALNFIKGSDFQLTPEYIVDVYKLTTLTSTHDALKAGAEVVKQTDNPKISGLLYPLLQILDEEYLDVDAQLGGVDQRRIFTLSNTLLSLLGYKKRIHLMNPMLTAIDALPQQDTQQVKMSASNVNSKIDMLDSKNNIKKKINKAYCLEGDVTFNPLLELTQLIIFPLLQNQNMNRLIINRHEKHGGPLYFTSFNMLKDCFINKDLHPQDLKCGIIDCLNKFIDLIRHDFIQHQDLLNSAYPHV